MRGSLSKFRGLIRPGVVAALFMGVVAAVTVFMLPSQADERNDRQIALTIKVLLKRQHLSKRPLDDLVSQRGLATYIKRLDPLKMYFLKSDIDEFLQKESELDDMLSKGDTSFAHVVFDRFLKRVDERVAVVKELLKQDLDFTKEESLITDREKLQYPANAKEAEDRWRKRVKYDLLVKKIEDVTGEEAIKKITRRYDSFAIRMHKFSDDDLMGMYLTAITSSYDPHTSYMSPAEYENFLIQMRLQLDGIGAALRSTDGQTIVTKIIPGGAADKHGKLKPEDQVVAVGQGENGDMVDILDMPLNEVVGMIRGKADTKVRLSVIPSGTSEVLNYTITRARIELKDSEARGVIFEKGKKENGDPLKVGVIDLPSFYMDMDAARTGATDYKSTTRDVRKLLEDFKKKGVDAVVLDLRRNGGGSLTEAINLTGLFIDNGPVVQVKDSDGRVQHYDDLERGMSWDGPLVVVTSKFSASASEILAGAIQDYRRGLVVGDSSTHGKGTVQTLLNLGEQLFHIPDPPNLGALKITMQQFYRPNGDSTQKRGVVSDLVLPSITDYLEDISESDLDYAIDFDRVDAANYDKVNKVNAEILGKVRIASQNRIKKNEDFAKEKKDIERYKQQKDRAAVPLNEKKFFADRAELDAEKEEEKQFEEKDNSDVVVERDYYFEEILSVTRDYLAALNGKTVASN